MRQAVRVFLLFGGDRCRTRRGRSWYPKIQIPHYLRSRNLFYLINANLLVFLSFFPCKAVFLQFHLIGYLFKITNDEYTTTGRYDY